MKTLAKNSGIVYLLIFISGFYANFAILETLVDLNKSEQTTFNIISNSIQFKNGLLGFFVMLISDVFLIWSLFKLTESTNKRLSYITSLFRGFHALFFIFGLAKLVQVYSITFGAVNTIELQNTVIYLLKSFDRLWTIGLLFFGIHLLLLGFLALKSHHIPRLIGCLLVLAALGYLIDGGAKLYIASYTIYQSYFEGVVICTGVIGELSFTIWLLIKGFSKKK